MFEKLRTQLENERTSFKPHWRDLNDHIMPRRARFFITDTNRGERRTQKIIDSTATLAVRTLRSGMMAGVTSPARPWFRLSPPSQNQEKEPGVKAWLDEVSKRMSTIFLKSNLYNVLPIVYGDMGVFSTAAMLMEEDEENIITFYPMPIGSYAIANNKKLQVDTFYREFQLTARQIVDKFARDPKDPTKVDWSIVSTSVKNYMETGLPETWLDVVHFVKPNEEWDPNKLGARYKKYISVYYERSKSVGDGSDSSSGGFGASAFSNKEENERFLRVSGYDYFPVLAPRWEVTGEDVYGNDCPGMTALGDIRQLQVGERRGMQAIEKMVNPPMVGPIALKNQKVSILPGDITYTDDREGQRGFRAAHEVRFDINALEAKQAQVRQRISRAFFEDLFLMLAQSDRRQITAREIDERHEEKLLALGPVLERLNQDLLDPLIDNAFAIMVKRGLVPDPPESMQGMDLKVEYISIMAQAQKLSSLAGIERFTGFMGQVAQFDPAVLDNIDTDKLADIYGDITSIPPGILREQADVDEMREQRAQAQAQQAQTEQASMQADTANKLAETEVGDESALDQLLAASQAGQ